MSDNSKRSIFSERLSLLQAEKGESQQAAADALKTKRQNFNNWTNSKTEPDFDMLVSIAKYYNVSTDYLLGRTDAPSPDTSVRAVEEATGLSEKAVKTLMTLKKGNNMSSLSDVLSLFLETHDFFDFISAFGWLVDCQIKSDRIMELPENEMLEARKADKIQVVVNGLIITTNGKDLLQTRMQNSLASSIILVSRLFAERFGCTPSELSEKFADHIKPYTARIIEAEKNRR